MLYETGGFDVTWPPPPGLARPARSPAAWVTWLAFTKSQSKVEDFECKSDSFPRSILRR